MYCWILDWGFFSISSLFYHTPGFAFGAGFALKDGLRLGLGPERKSRAPDLAFGAGLDLKDGERLGLGSEFISRV